MEEEQVRAQPRRTCYDLFGVVNHFGPMGYGHYTAYVKNARTNSWWLMNDAQIAEESGPENIVTENAYILFYQK